MVVTPNLAAALNRLRRADSPRSFWIDALCINQEVLPERTQQVALMGDIYTFASQAIIWLGEDHGEALAAFKLIRTACTSFQQETPKYDIKQLVGEGLDMSKHRDRGFPEVHSAEWQCLTFLRTRLV